MVSGVRLFLTIAIVLLFKIERSTSQVTIESVKNGTECSALVLTDDNQWKKVDLSPLKGRILKVEGSDKEYPGEMYQLSLCQRRNFTEYGSCLNQMLVYENSKKKECSSMGNVSRLMMENGQLRLHVYHSRDSHKELYIGLNCSREEATLKCKDPKECSFKTPDKYSFVLNSKLACLKGIPKVSAVEPTPAYKRDWLRLSPGSIVLIAVASVFVTYMVIGVAYGTGMGEKGFDRMPNSDFWQELPLLVKDGIIFTFRCRIPLNRGYSLIKESRSDPAPADV